MALKYVLLTLLDRERKTGYEIVKTFESAVGYFWNASHQQVYRELSKLTDDGRVKFSSVKQEDKPDKKVYRITTTGKKDLQQWLLEPVKNPPPKDLMLVKLLNLRTENVEVILAELDQAIERAEETSAIYQGIKKRYYPASEIAKLELQDLALYLALRKGMTGVAANLGWLQETKAAIVARSHTLQ